MATRNKAFVKMDFKKLIHYSLYSEINPKSNQPSVWNWNLSDLGLSISIFPNTEPYDKNNTNAKESIISFYIPGKWLGLFFELCEDCINLEPGDKRYFEKTIEIFDPNTRQVTDKTKFGHIVIGKDKEGIIWLAVVVDGKTNIQFKLMPKDTWQIKMNGGDVAEPSYVSKIYAKTVFRGVMRACENMLNTAELVSKGGSDITKDGLSDDSVF